MGFTADTKPVTGREFKPFNINFLAANLTNSKVWSSTFANASLILTLIYSLDSAGEG